MRKGKVLNMQESIVNESTRRGIFRRVLVAVMALAAVLTLGACKATGGGQIDDPVPSGVLPTGDIEGTFTGDANFGFNFTCEMTAKNKAVIKGEITYHDTGTSDGRGASTFGPDQASRRLSTPCLHHRPPTCEAAAEIFLDAAQFEGTYRSQDTSLLSALPGRFTVLVFDQGEPGRTNDPAFVTGDGFSIELAGGPYTLYTRAGYIEGGNIQVDNT